MQKFIGIEIGGTKLQLVLGDAQGKIESRHQLVVDTQRGAVGIREQIQHTLPGLLRDSNVAGIGVGFGGPVDWKTGKISRSHQIEGWSEFDLNGWLTTQSGLKVAVENDGNVAARAKPFTVPAKTLTRSFTPRSAAASAAVSS